MNGRVMESAALPRSAIEEAASWYLRLQEAGSEQVFSQWQRWLNASATNRRAYEQIETASLRMGSIPDVALALPTGEQMQQDRYDGSVPVSEWNRASLRQSESAAMSDRARTAWPASGWRWSALAAGAAVAAIAIWVAVGHRPELRTVPVSYQTGSGQQKTVTLADGSTITLDADSQVEVRMTRNKRALHLRRGEAYFEVARDQRRPFVVAAGDAKVTALGTAFNIRLSADRTVVAVTEGKVVVTAAPRAVAGQPGPRHRSTLQLSAQLAAGEAVSYIENGNLYAVPPEDVHLVTGWLEGRRQYRDEPLRYVLADVDRYTDRQIDIADPAVGELRFTGTLNLRNSAAWLEGLVVALPVQITEMDDRTLSVRLAAR